MSSKVPTIMSHRWLHNINNKIRHFKYFYVQAKHLTGPWGQVAQPEAAVTTWDTGVSPDLLKIFAHKSVSFPDDFVSSFLLGIKTSNDSFM